MMTLSELQTRIFFRSSNPRTLPYLVYRDKEGHYSEAKNPHIPEEGSEEKKIYDILVKYKAQEFLDHNALGYLKQLSKEDDDIKMDVHFLKHKEGDTIYLALELTDAIKEALGKIYGKDKLDKISNPVEKVKEVEGNTEKEYQIIGVLSLADTKEVYGTTRAFYDELNRQFGIEFKDLNDETYSSDGFVASSVTSNIEAISTGRLHKKNEEGKAIATTSLKKLLGESLEFANGQPFLFGINKKGKIKTVEKEDDRVDPSDTKLKEENNNGAIYIYLPKPDGMFYAIRCIRKTLKDWLASHQESLKERIKSNIENSNDVIPNVYLDTLIDAIKTLFDTKESIAERIKAREILKTYLCFPAEKHIRLSFEEEVPQVNIKSGKKDDIGFLIAPKDSSNEALEEAILLVITKLGEEGVKFSVPMEVVSSVHTINLTEGIIDSDILDVRLAGFYNFNADFYLRPVTRDETFTDEDIDRAANTVVYEGSPNRGRSQFSVVSPNAKKEDTIINTDTRFKSEKMEDYVNSTDPVIELLNRFDERHQQEILDALRNLEAVKPETDFDSVEFMKKMKSMIDKRKKFLDYINSLVCG